MSPRSAAAEVAGWGGASWQGRARVERRIVGFHQDEQGDWVADLECGHTQHVRHNPPWIERPWVITPQGRQRHLGMPLHCRTCDDEREVRCH